MTVSEPTDEAAGPDGREASGDGGDAGRPRRTGIEVPSTLPLSPESSPEAAGPDPSAVLLEAPGEEEVAVVAWPLLWKQRGSRRAGATGSNGAGGSGAGGSGGVPADHDDHGDAEERSRRAARAERSPWLVLAAALFGLFSVGFSITVLSIAVTDIAREFDTTDNVVIWVITGPLLLGAIVTPAAGKLADLFGARRVYLTAMCLVALFAALDLDLFTKIAGGAATLTALAEATGVAPNRLRTLLTTLKTVGLVTEADGAFANAPATATYLVAGAPGDHRVLVADRADARRRRRDHRVVVPEHVDEATHERDGLTGIPRVREHLAAAGLRGRELDSAPEPLEQAYRRLRRLRPHRVVEARGEERDPKIRARRRPHHGNIQARIVD